MRQPWTCFKGLVIWTLTICGLLECTGCERKLPSAAPLPKEVKPSEPTPQPTKKSNAPVDLPLADSLYFTHSEAAALAFLDSVASLNPRRLDDFIQWDTVSQAFPAIHKQLSEAQYGQLRKGCRQGFLTRSLGKQLRLDVDIFSTLGDSIPVELQPLGKDEAYFAVVSYPKHKWEAKVAFFKGHELVEVHAVHPGFVFKVNSYLDAQGRRVVSYPDMQSEGMGAWQFERNYYHWEEGGLRPVLRVLEEGRFGNDTRDFWLVSKQIRFDSMVVRIDYDQLLRYDLEKMLDYEDDTLVPLIHGSTNVRFAYDSMAQRYVADWSHSSLSHWQMLTYLCYDNEHMFLRTHARNLRRCLQGKDVVKRRAVHHYLCEVMNGEYPQGVGARR